MKSFDDTPESEFPEAFRSAEADRLRAVRERDGTLMGSLLSKGMRYIESDGKVLSREEYLGQFTSGELSYDADLNVEDQHNFQEGDVFVMVGLVEAHVRSHGKMSGQTARYSSTWIRHENGWQVLLVQKTLVGR